MNVLIVGSDINAIVLAQYLKNQNKEHDIYITKDTLWEDSDCIPVNIKESDIVSICDFVKYNQIEFTIVTSPIALINGIADELKQEGFPVFCPLSESARITYLNSVAKKIIYKLKINTPRFGIFDRENLAIDYVRNAKFPLLIQNDLTLISRENRYYDTFSKAKLGIQEIFDNNNNNEKIIIENYIDVAPVYMYFLTDGYNALPLITLERFANKEFTKTIVPDGKVSDDMLVKIMHKVIYPLLDDIKQYAGAYTGILGLKAILSPNNFYVLEFYNNFQYYDFQAFLSVLNENILDLYTSITDGSFIDNYNYIDLSDFVSYTISINKGYIGNIDEDLPDNFLLSDDGENYIFTTKASTINQAKNDLYEYLEYVCDKSILEKIKTDDKTREKRI